MALLAAGPHEATTATLSDEHRTLQAARPYKEAAAFGRDVSAAPPQQNLAWLVAKLISGRFILRERENQHKKSNPPCGEVGFASRNEALGVGCHGSALTRCFQLHFELRALGNSQIGEGTAWYIWLSALRVLIVRPRNDFHSTSPSKSFACQIWPPRFSAAVQLLAASSPRRLLCNFI
ncbi:hypothetical protein D4764_05G0002630 [Takifugu flavidus]|uniref:Uncharacterized protein n=1 Tax=Takifugu flavidus TaxID=433684 RepID=A0A5C6MYV6_9TELE|nr:hypothetical protein D4764_05G0002630 [Takifugu flavidus]